MLLTTHDLERIKYLMSVLAQNNDGVTPVAFEGTVNVFIDNKFMGSIKVCDEQVFLELNPAKKAVAEPGKVDE